MGGWFVPMSLGGKLSGEIGQYWTKLSHADFFAVLVLACLSATIALFVMLRFVKKSMPGV